MKPRARSATAIVTWIVMCLVAIAVPVAQLTTVSTRTSCCCPNPARCHCPDHKSEPSNNTTLQACHRTTHHSVATQLPSVTAPDIAVVEAPDLIATAAIRILPTPHDEPAPIEPAGPS
jgi:hypothetical protein